MNSACEYCSGTCCKCIVIPMHIDFDEDGNKLLEYRGIVKVEEGTLIPLTCKYLKDGKCTIEGNKPELCRKYKVGGEHCIKVIKRLCPEKLDGVMERLKWNKK